MCTITQSACKIEDEFFIDKYDVTAYEWRCAIANGEDPLKWVRYRNAKKMSCIDAHSRRQPGIITPRPDNGNHKERTPNPPLQIDFKTDLCEFPYVEVFCKDIPAHTKYKGVYNIVWYKNQSVPYVKKWFSNLNNSEKDKLNRIMSMLNDKYYDIKSEGKYYALSEVAVIGYCIMCKFYDKEITRFGVSNPMILITKEVSKFMDVFCKCFTMCYDRVADQKNEPDIEWMAAVPCNNFRRREEQKHFNSVYAQLIEQKKKYDNNSR